ncbi:hypothetical protein [Nocardia sp. NPDC052566]|uniref:hypothetical protein n=1 Tax=Nocardia sp. NPDC052566 TaxID=3364330 RepID=UPI0037C7C562
MRDQDPTLDEERFFAALRAQVADIDEWYHADADGALWVIASLDFVDGENGIHDTLRVDYDGVSLRGGLSPMCLNGDDGVRAADAGIDTVPPDGLCLDNIGPLPAASAAAEWFLR